MPGLRIHDLRHSWASTAVMNGVDMVTVAKLLGHSNIETTAGYAHLADGHLVEAAEKVGAFVARAMDGTAPPPDAALSKPRRFVGI